MRHVGILAHSTEGASLCFLAFCQQGFRRLGRTSTLISLALPWLQAPYRRKRR